MTSHLLSPRMATLLSRIRRAQKVPLSEMTVQQARQLYEAGAEVLDLPREPLGRVESVLVPTGQARSCEARLYAASHERLPVLLYLHGGGFTLGSLETHDSLCRQLALRSGAAILALHYRRAPEHRFPAAVDDVWLALQWLAESGAQALGLDASRLAVGGDSAGGTLAAVAAIEAARAQLPLRAQVLITPGAGAQTNTPSHAHFGQGFLLDADTLSWFYNHYIDDSHRHDWRFAPLHAPEHDGAAPAIVLLAECDPLVDEGLAYADKLRAAGTTVALDLVRGVTHDFIKMGRSLPEAITAQQWVADMLRERLF